MRKPEDVSAIVLAGGYSTRMGRGKTELLFRGQTFLFCQVDKLKKIGIKDIILSGYMGEVPGTRSVPDSIPHRGPLSGIHAGLSEAVSDAALILAADMPLVPPGLLRELIAGHEEGVTLAACKGRMEPLIGVYDRALAADCRELLMGEDRRVQSLLNRTKVTSLAFEGDPSLLMNCNTPEDYASLLAYEAEGR